MSPQNTQSPDWGLLANSGFERQKLKAVYFFAGNWRYHGQKSDDDPSQWYEFPVDPNYKKYTIYPLNRQHLGWSESQANRDFAISQMLDVGANVVVMSYWGERGNGPWTDPLDWNDRWVGYAPMHTSTMAHDGRELRDLERPEDGRHDHDRRREVHHHRHRRPAGGQQPRQRVRPAHPGPVAGRTRPGGSLKNDVNTVYVTAASAADISAVQSEIAKVLPGAKRLFFTPLALLWLLLLLRLIGPLHA